MYLFIHHGAKEKKGLGFLKLPSSSSSSGLNHLSSKRESASASIQELSVSECNFLSPTDECFRCSDAAMATRRGSVLRGGHVWALSVTGGSATMVATSDELWLGISGRVGLGKGD
jgi:hypothetical protein